MNHAATLAQIFSTVEREALFQMLDREISTIHVLGLNPEAELIYRAIKGKLTGNEYPFPINGTVVVGTYQTSFTVTYTSNAFVQVIKTIRVVFGLGLKEAKDWHDVGLNMVQYRPEVNGDVNVRKLYFQGASPVQHNTFTEETNNWRTRNDNPDSWDYNPPARGVARFINIELGNHLV